MELSNSLVEYLLSYHKRLIERSFLLDICSALGKHPVLENIPNRGVGYKLFCDGKSHVEGDIVVMHSIVGDGNNKTTDMHEVCYVSKKDPSILKGGDSTWQAIPLGLLKDYMNRPLFDAIDTFTLPKDFMHNKTGVKTTFGRFLFNYIIWYQHAEVDLEYNNEQQKAGSLGDLIAKMLLAKTISPDTGRKIINSVFYMASFTALFVPTLTEKALMNSPEVMQRKKELLEEYGDRLKDPIVAKEYEQELIALDKKWLDGDKSLRFLNALDEKKTYGIHRKKLFIGIGGIPAFDQGSNAYTFIPNSLSEGWTVDAFPDICNEIRKGAYDRGKETAKGGEQTKFLLRVFQDVRITEDDCGSHQGIPMTFTEDTVKEYFGQYIVTPSGPILLSADTASKFIGKTVLMRSPMFCHTKIGRCKICSGNMFNELDAKAIGMTVLKVGSRFTTLSMKNMHGTVITTQKIDPFNFVIQN